MVFLGFKVDDAERQRLDEVLKLWHHPSLGQPTLCMSDVARSALRLGLAKMQEDLEKRLAEQSHD